MPNGIILMQGPNEKFKVLFFAHEVVFEEFIRTGFPNYVTHRAKP